jgi:hypothetical protein
MEVPVTDQAQIRPFRIEIPQAHRTFFECECGQVLTLADREDEARTRKGRLVGRPR